MSPQAGRRGRSIGPIARVLPDIRIGKADALRDVAIHGKRRRAHRSDGLLSIHRVPRDTFPPRDRRSHPIGPFSTRDSRREPPWRIRPDERHGACRAGRRSADASLRPARISRPTCARCRRRAFRRRGPSVRGTAAGTFRAMTHLSAQGERATAVASCACG